MILIESIITFFICALPACLAVFAAFLVIMFMEDKNK